MHRPLPGRVHRAGLRVDRLPPLQHHALHAVAGEQRTTFRLQRPCPGEIRLVLVDGGTSKLIWRGWAERSIEGVLENQDWMERDVNQAVAKICERLPQF